MKLVYLITALLGLGAAYFPLQGPPSYEFMNLHEFDENDRITVRQFNDNVSRTWSVPHILEGRAYARIGLEARITSDAVDPNPYYKWKLHVLNGETIVTGMGFMAQGGGSQHDITRTSAEYKQFDWDIPLTVLFWADTPNTQSEDRLGYHTQPERVFALFYTDRDADGVPDGDQWIPNFPSYILGLIPAGLLIFGKRWYQGKRVKETS